MPKQMSTPTNIKTNHAISEDFLFCSITTILQIKRKTEISRIENADIAFSDLLSMFFLF